MNKLIKPIAVLLFIVAILPFLISCEEPEPKLSDIYETAIGRGESFTASDGSLQFRIVNNYPDIYAAPGLSNYYDSPQIAFIGEVESIEQVALPPANVHWENKCAIVDHGGYVIKVTWYDPMSRDYMPGLMYMFVEKIGDSHYDPTPGVFHDEIRITYRLSR